MATLEIQKIIYYSNLERDASIGIPGDSSIDDIDDEFEEYDEEEFYHDIIIRVVNSDSNMSGHINMQQSGRGREVDNEEWSTDNPRILDNVDIEADAIESPMWDMINTNKMGPDWGPDNPLESVINGGIFGTPKDTIYEIERVKIDDDGYYWRMVVKNG